MAEGIRVYRADTGSCNGCDIEVLASLDPKYGLGELNVSVAEHPEEANVLLVTGFVTKKNEPELKKIYEKIQDPRIVIAYGQCAVGKDVFYDSYNAAGAVDEVIPVNLYIPGCPPSPRATLFGIITALDKADFKKDAEIWNVPEAFRGRVEVDEEKCIGCGACAKICPSTAIDVEQEQDKMVLRFWHSKCIRCGSCKDICPPEAITMSKEYRLATDDRQKLHLDITKGLQKCAGCGEEFVPTQVPQFGFETATGKTMVKLKALGIKQPPPELKEFQMRMLQQASFCPDCRKTLDNVKKGKNLLLNLNLMTARMSAGKP